MRKLIDTFLQWRQLLLWAVLVGMQAAAVAQTEPPSGTQARIQIASPGKQLMVGDVIFIRVSALPFKKVAGTTMSWTNHVGIVADVSGKEPLIAESTFPLSRTTTWSRFVERSERGRVAVGRLGQPLDQQQRSKLAKAAAARAGILYDTGFDLHSRGQFCSRYVREVLNDATGVQLGQVESFSVLLKNNPQADLSFWRAWYFGYIPWQRETVTPASLLNDARLHIIFDGYAGTANSNKGD